MPSEMPSCGIIELRGRDVAEAKVTQEMAEAGAAELAAFNPEIETPEEAVSRIYRSMVALGRFSFRL